MISVRLTLGSEEINERSYIIDRLSLHSTVSVEVTEHKKITTIDIKSQSKCFYNIIRDIIGNVILIFYKFRMLTDGVKSNKIDGMVYYALMGALLSFDKEQEMEIIQNELEGDSFSIKTIFEFKHTKLKESWQNIISLANKLISQCVNEDDIFDLIYFILAIDNSVSPKVQVDSNKNGIKLYSDSIETPIPKLTNDENANAIISIVRERPLSVIIMDSNKTDKELIRVIKKLGNG